MLDSEKERLQQQLKEALIAIKKLKSGLIEERNKKHEPIAIIGMGLRFPGKVNNAQEYWDLLYNGVDAISDIPKSRFDAEALYDANPEALGKINVKQGGFLDKIDEFDGSFFDLSYAEIESMDPQQRLLLEVTYEALENAGITLPSLANTNTGVFVGVTNNDYQKRHFRSGDLTLINPYSYTGSAVCSNSGRISYLLGLQGPSVSLDTACSSSLVATHLATQSLRSGECDIAIAGAANVIIDPEFTIYFSTLNALSKDSRCKSFSNEANGFIRSEGCGIFILKRLSDAQRDGDNVLAVIKGSAVNQDGRSNGFTAPNVKAQEILLAKALENAQLKPEQVAFIEAHGTGTKIGDPIEMEAITEVFASAKTKEDPLYVGSVKTNIGHTEGVAGMAGMSKAILSLQKGLIPQNLHFQTPNELIDWESLPVKVPTENTPLDTQKYIGVSGFGVTGTNAHVIIGAAPVSQKSVETVRNDLYVLTLSAKSLEALRDLVQVYAEFIQTSGEKLEDICAMAALKRTAFEERKVFVAKSKEDLIEQLNDFVELEAESLKKYDIEDYVKVVFVCPGQGAQWVGMAQELYKSEPVFKASIDSCAQAYQSYATWNLLEELKGDNFDQLDIIQPTLVAIEIALGQLWKSKGIQPDVVIGHSMGEIAAAYLADMITLDEAARIICTRSQLMKQTSGQGAMAVTDLTLEEAQKALVGQESLLSIAVQNSLRSTVIAGDPSALQALLDKLDAEGRFCRMIKVDVASHSPQMDALIAPLEQELQSLQPKNGSIEFYSTALQSKMKGEQLTAEYWGKNLRNPVAFGAVVRSLVQSDKVIFIELTPHPVLSTAIQENLESIKKSGTTIASLLREKDETISFYKALGQYFESGLSLDWKKIYPSIGKFVLLPNYQWQKERFWFEQIPNIVATAETAKIESIEELPINELQGHEEKLEESPVLVKEEPVTYNIFETVWEKVSLQAQKLPASAVIIKDSEGLGQQIAELLLQKGVQVEAILPSERPLMLPDAVIHVSCTNVKATQQDAIFSFRDLIQYFSDKGKSPKLYAVSKNGQIISDEDRHLHIPSTALWGLMRTIRNEYPELKPVTIDVNSSATAQDIIQVIGQDEQFKEWAYRSNRWFVPKLKGVAASQRPAENFNSASTYLVTGGTSGLGLVFAEWLASKGVRNLALVSRSGMKPETAPVVDRLREKGIRVEVFKSDVANPDELGKLVVDVESKLPTIRGVVHAAGVLDDGAFLNLSAEQFNRVLAPKINGGWNLHKFFSGRNLESFVLFSSGASVLGTAGQANYTAANMALDQLANYRKSLGLAALSINFGNIAEIGLAAADTRRGENLKDQGMGLIYPDQLPQLLDEIFDLPGAQYMLMDIDFQKWSELNGGIKNNYFFSEVLKYEGEKEDNVAEEDVSTTGADEGRPYQNKAGAIRHYKTVVKGFVSTITKIPTSKIKEDATFKSLGIDSLMAVQLKNKLQEATSLELTVSSIWTYPTVEKYAEFIVEELNIQDEEPANEIEEEVKVEEQTLHRSAAIRQFKNVIKQHLSSITKIPTSKVKEDATFKSMGVDSLMAVQLKNKFQEEFNITIAVSSIWTYSSVEKYAEFVADELGYKEEVITSEEASAPQVLQLDVEESPAPNISVDQIENEVSQMSLDDLLKALDD